MSILKKKKKASKKSKINKIIIYYFDKDDDDGKDADPRKCATWLKSRYSHGIGHDQQVHIVKKADLRHLHDKHIQDLDEEHEEEFTNTADL